MSVETVTGFKCSDGRIFGEKKEADAHEVRLNVEQWVDDGIEKGLMKGGSRTELINYIVEHRDELRSAMNGTYHSNRLVAVPADEPEATHG